MVRPSSCIVKGGIPSSRRPTYLPYLPKGDAMQQAKFCKCCCIDRPPKKTWFLRPTLLPSMVSPEWGGTKKAT